MRFFADCGKSFSIISNFAKHKRRHLDEFPVRFRSFYAFCSLSVDSTLCVCSAQYSCDYPGCNKKFKESPECKNHKARVHSENRPFPCDVRVIVFV
jgi:hypothetical protein